MQQRFVIRVGNRRGPECVATAPRSPWQNGHVERLIGSVRRECLDHIVVVSEVSLHRPRKAYARYFNEVRTHRSLEKDTLETRPIQFTGMICSRPVLGGLHHHYVRVAMAERGVTGRYQLSSRTGCLALTAANTARAATAKCFSGTHRKKPSP
jgi:hypothetical protein